MKADGLELRGQLQGGSAGVVSLRPTRAEWIEAWAASAVTQAEEGVAVEFTVERRMKGNPWTILSN